MEARDLGISGLQLPAVGLGAHRAFDVNGREAQQARSALTRSVLVDGTSLFHTSDAYGEASRVLGASLLSSRKRAIVAASITARDRRDGHRQLERMLHYFDGYIDLLAYPLPGSAPDYDPVFQRLRERGEVRALGLQVTETDDYGAARRLIENRQIDYVEIPYTPNHDPERERFLGGVSRLGIGVLAVMPFHGGHLARLHPPSASLAKFEDLGIHTWPQLIIKWVLSNPHVTSVIVGTRRAARLVSAIEVADGPWLSQEQREQVLRVLGGMQRG